LKKLASVGSVTFLFLLTCAWAEVTKEDYARAEQFLLHSQKLAFKLRVTPQWIHDSSRFWYKNDSRDGKEFVIVDPVQNVHRPAFDHARLASSLSKETGKACEAHTLPFDSIEFAKGKNEIAFDVGEERWTCDLSSYSCAKVEGYKKPAEYRLTSPDEKWAAFVKDHNLYIQPLPEGEAVQLTIDGETYNDYGTRAETSTMSVTVRIQGMKLPPVAIWSPDSKKIITHRLDQRKVKELYLLQNSPPGDSKRPVLHTYRYSMPGDDDVALSHYVLIDVDERTVTEIEYEPQPVTYMSAFNFQMVWWDKDSTKVYFIFSERGSKAVRLCEIDSATGSVREIFRENTQTQIDLNVQFGMPPNVRILGGSHEFIWFSERDGWGHLYLYNNQTGQLKNQITKGSWVVRDIMHVDESNRLIYFTASGHEKGRDPYYRHLYSIKLDGTGLKLLSSEDADHSIAVSPDGRYFTDTYSRVDLPPKSVLRASDGKIIKVMEESDVGLLLNAGFTFPERFKVKARDGITDIYGIIIHPFHFNPEIKYPVIDGCYPGPQAIRCPKSFIAGGGDIALSALGFVVINIDGMGTPLRSKAFHDVSYGNLGEAGGLVDHVTGFRQLAATRPYLDLNRVGIYGHSGGGFMTGRAMVMFPDFYKVGVSGAGNHDQRGYVALWGEKYQGMVEGDNYLNQATALLAKNLQGKLLISCGEMDDNVHPALTIQLIEAFIKENKDFDMLYFPNTNHSYGPVRNYWTRKTWDYFVEHLLGEEAPQGYKIGELYK